MSETAGRPAPTPSAETAAFWEGTREGKFLLQRCSDCGNTQYYYRAFCAHCWSASVEPFSSAGQGTVWSFGVVHRGAPAGFSALVPYVVALVELEHDVKVLTNIIDTQPSDVRVGMPVQLTFIEDDMEYPVPVFTPR